MNRSEPLSIEKSVPGRRALTFPVPSAPAASWLPGVALRDAPPACRN